MMRTWPFTPSTLNSTFVTLARISRSSSSLVRTHAQVRDLQGRTFDGLHPFGVGRAEFPNADGLILAGGNQFVLRSEVQGCYRVAMTWRAAFAWDAIEQFPGRGIPKLDGMILAAGGARLAVRTERDTEDRPSMSIPQLAQRFIFITVEIPEPSRTLLITPAAPI